MDLSRERQLRPLAEAVAASSAGAAYRRPPMEQLEQMDPDVQAGWHLVGKGSDSARLIGQIPGLVTDLAGIQTGVRELVPVSDLPWKLMGLDDLLKPAEPPRFLVSPILRVPSVVSLYGRPGTLKSMLLMDLLVAVATGLPWLPREDDATGVGFAVEQAPALWIDLDQGRDRLRERLGALVRGRGTEVAKSALHALSLPSPPLDLGNDRHMDWVCGTMLQIGGKLCVIDNLCAASGGRDENSSAMAKVMSNARSIAETTDSVIVLIHHSRKSRAESSGDSGSDLRGHSSVEAALDLSLRVTRRDDNVVLRATKCRDQRLPDFEAIWRYTSGQDGALQSGAFYRSSSLVHEQPKYRSVATEAPKVVRVIRTETGEWPNQSRLRREMREKLKVSDSVARSAIEEAVEAGRLECEKTGSHATAPVLYRLPRETMPLPTSIDVSKA